jgi:hypothetical protein
MHLSQIECPISDFDTWKGAFDRFPELEAAVGRAPPLSPPTY